MIGLATGPRVVTIRRDVELQHGSLRGVIEADDGGEREDQSEGS